MTDDGLTPFPRGTGVFGWQVGGPPEFPLVGMARCGARALVFTLPRGRKILLKADVDTTKGVCTLRLGPGPKSKEGEMMLALEKAINEVVCTRLLGHGPSAEELAAWTSEQAMSMEEAAQLLSGAPPS